MKTFLQAVHVFSLCLAILAVLTFQASATGFHSAPYSTLVDTPAISIPFVVSPNGFYNSFGVNFGIHAGATKGIDPSLGESEYPPFPPCCAYTMFVSADGVNSILDLRPYSSPSQIDTFAVGLSTELQSYPIVFTWPDLHSYYSGSVRLKMGLSGSVFNIDMKAQNSYTLTSGPYIDPNFPPPFWATLTVYIVAEGPLGGTSMPVISTYGVSGGGFQAIVNAPAGGTTASTSASGIAAGTTSVWFEYGPTKGYGTSTPPQTIPGGTSANVTQPFNPGSLPLNTRIHFRSVAQNSVGTFYGGDRVVSNGTPPPEAADTSGLVMYRTAAYRDWADAKDTKGKRKSLKGQPDRMAFTIGVQCKSAGVSDLTIEFGSVIDTDVVGNKLTVTPGANSITTDAKLKKWHLQWLSPLTNGDSVHVSGVAWGGKTFKVSKYAWGNPAGKPQKGYAVTAKPGLPMPNLHNVGEGIYGGVKQTSVDITIGVNDDPKGAHTVYHSKYTDIMKSLVKEQGKAPALYHTNVPRWLNTFDKNGQSISKKQKSLPPDKHNNILLAEALTLKLNVAASDSGIFPKGLGDLFYSNSTPFDGKTIRQIIAQADSFLGRAHDPPEDGDVTDSTMYLKFVQDINTAFAGPMDTLSWSGGKVVCTGVKMLKDIPYLYAGPSAAPGIVMRNGLNSGRINQPFDFRLEQNFPNPFNPVTTIHYQLPTESFVRLSIYNMLGQEVMNLVNQTELPGYKSVQFDGSAISSGAYFYRISAGTFTDVKKMLLIK